MEGQNPGFLTPNPVFLTLYLEKGSHKNAAPPWCCQRVFSRALNKEQRLHGEPLGENKYHTLAPGPLLGPL